MWHASKIISKMMLFASYITINALGLALFVAASPALQGPESTVVQTVTLMVTPTVFKTITVGPEQVIQTSQPDTTSQGLTTDPSANTDLVILSSSDPPLSIQTVPSTLPTASSNANISMKLQASTNTPSLTDLQATTQSFTTSSYVLPSLHSAKNSDTNTTIIMQTSTTVLSFTDPPSATYPPPTSTPINPSIPYIAPLLPTPTEITSNAEPTEAINITLLSLPSNTTFSINITDPSTFNKSESIEININAKRRKREILRRRLLIPSLEEQATEREVLRVSEDSRERGNEKRAMEDQAMKRPLEENIKEESKEERRTRKEKNTIFLI